MKVKIKKLFEDAILPTYATDGSAGLDFTALNLKYHYHDSVGNNDHRSSQLKFIEYGTGISISVPKDHVGLIFPRSSITNKGLMLGNAVGVIDSDYRGEIKFRFKRVPQLSSDEYKVGEKIGQIVIIPIPKIELELADKLDETKRGEGGYGSSGS
jgi:dUTP pyrophosphatase